MATTEPASPLPPLSHILETCLYVRSVPESSRFYKEILQIEPFMESPRVAGFKLGATTLLLFELGKTTTDMVSDEGVIPLHGPTQSILTELLGDSRETTSLKQHVCFAVDDPAEVGKWDEHLQAKGAKISGRMNWERGGKSVYFEDPDGHVAEIGSRGIWPHY